MSIPLHGDATQPANKVMTCYGLRTGFHELVDEFLDSETT